VKKEKNVQKGGPARIRTFGLADNGKHPSWHHLYSLENQQLPKDQFV
jgi:hypothetical protein